MTDEYNLPDQCEASIENVRWVLNNRSARTFVWGETKQEKKDSQLLIDMQTANAAIAVYDALGESNQAKAREMLAHSKVNAIRFFNACWKIIGAVNK